MTETVDPDVIAKALESVQFRVEEEIDLDALDAPPDRNNPALRRLQQSPGVRLGMSPLMRRVYGGASMGGSEALLDALGLSDIVPAPAEGIGGGIAEFGGAIAGGFGVGTPVRAGAKALMSRLVPGALEASPRAAQVGLGAVENISLGGARGAFDQDESALSTAGEEAAFGLVIDGAMTGLGAIIGRGLRWVPGIKVPKPKTKDPTLLDPFQKRTVSEWDGMNNGIREIAEREGVPQAVPVLRPHSAFTEWVFSRAKQAGAMKDYLDELNIKIDRSFKAWARRVTDSIKVGGAGSPGAIQTGEVLQHEFDSVIDGYKSSASQAYDDVLEQVGNRIEIPTHDIADRLRSLIENYEGIPHPIINRIRSAIRKIDPPPPEVAPSGLLDQFGAELPAPAAEALPDVVRVNAENLWILASEMYPKAKSWDREDVIASKAFRIIKGAVRDGVGEFDPVAKSVFEKGDTYWTRAMSLQEGRFGKILSGDPDDIVRNLTKNTSTLSEARELMGPEFTREIARRKIGEIIRVSTRDGTEQLSYKALRSELAKHGGIESKYWDVLLEEAPEAKESLSDLFHTMGVYEPGRKLLDPSQEALGAGKERVSFVGLANNISEAILLLTHFATGKRLAKAMVDVPSRNPLLGGVRPAAAEGSFVPTLAKTLRRTGAASGTGGEVRDRIFPR